MCCLFGIMDYGHKLSRKEKTKILSVLSVACEERGTDATGIAYGKSGIQIHKEAKSAYAIRFKNTDTIQGLE